MALLDTSHKRKSAVMTSIVAVIMLLLMFIFGLTYLDPPEEYGIAVNFGTTDFGSGNKQPTEALKPAAQSPEESISQDEPIEEVQEEVLEEAAEPEAAPEEVSEEVITQVNEEAIAIKKREEKRKREASEAEAKAKAKRKAEAEQKAEVERKRVAEAQKAEKKRQEQEAKRRSADAILGGFSDGDGKADGGEGDDNQAGDKGKVTGDPNASGYYGIGGDGSGGNYRLSNRNALNRPEPDYPCNEEGKVVVTISVDQSGNVVSAEPGAKGTTNSASCLLNEAKKAALKTNFQHPDNQYCSINDLCNST